MAFHMSNGSNLIKKSGFTIIELLIVLAIIAMLASLVAPRYLRSLDSSKEVALRHDLDKMRGAISSFYSDQNRYPDSLEELVDRGYLKSIPVDPINERSDLWLLVPPPSDNHMDGIYDIKSGAAGEAMDGTPYSDF